MPKHTLPAPEPTPVVGYGLRFLDHGWYVLNEDGTPHTDRLGKLAWWDSFSDAWDNRRIGRA